MDIVTVNIGNQKIGTNLTGNRDKSSTTSDNYQQLSKLIKCLKTSIVDIVIIEIGFQESNTITLVYKEIVTQQEILLISIIKNHQSTLLKVIVIISPSLTQWW